MTVNLTAVSIYQEIASRASISGEGGSKCSACLTREARGLVRILSIGSLHRGFVVSRL